jgi:hypothetical protein
MAQGEFAERVEEEHRGCPLIRHLFKFIYPRIYTEAMGSQAAPGPVEVCLDASHESRKGESVVSKV